jgi:GNAT superfamily N-acetyltransferase
MLEITEVKTRRDRNAFITLPYRLYRGDPNFVPPLRLQVKDLLTDDKNMQFGYGPHAMFLLRKDGRAAGRVLIGIDEGFNRENGMKSAWFSFFECERDEEAAEALLEACERWARAHGMDMLRGPMSPDNGDDFKGLLVMGFDGPPALLNAYNPPWYPEFFDRHGFVKDEDLYGYCIDRQTFEKSKLDRIVPYAMRKFNYRIDSVDKKQLRREVEDIQRILQDTIPTLEGNWMAVPSADDVEKEARFLLPMVDSDFICIARTRDTNRPVGFVVAIPEYNQIFRRLRNGRILPFGVIQFLRYRKRINALRVFIQFVVPDYQNKGVNAAIFRHIFEKAMEKGILMADGSTIGELNLSSRLSVEKLGGKHYRTYRTYRKQIV